jgi:DNA-binding NarL/FixJ family response regulator
MSIKTSDARRVLLVEDNAIVRMAQVLTMQQFPAINIVDQAVDGPDAVDKASRILPDVILMDIGLPCFDGIEATRLIKQSHPQCRIIILTAQTTDRSIFDSLAAGADGFCDKDIEGATLADIIHFVCTGAVWLDASIAARILRHCSVVDKVEELETFAMSAKTKLNVTLEEYGALTQLTTPDMETSGKHLLTARGDTSISVVLRRLFTRFSKVRD